MRSLAPVALPVLLAFLVASPARADIPPPDACTTAGQPCSNAGPSANQPGMCTASKCTKTLPNGDGGFTTTERDCLL